MNQLYKLFFLITLFFFSLSATAQKIDSLKRALKTQAADSDIVFTLISIGDYYDNNNQTDSALFYLNQAVVKALSLTDKKFLGGAYYQTGLAYSNAGKDAKARFYFLKAANIYLKINRISRLGWVYNSIGVSYYYEGKYDSAIANYTKASVFAQENKDSTLVGQCYNNIGIMYDIKGERIKSVDNYIKAIKIYEASNNQALCLGPYQNIALVYINNQQYPEALKNLETAKKLAIKYRESKTLCQVYNSVGSVFDEQSKPEQANIVFKQALAIAEQEKDQSLRATSLNNLGENNALLKNYAEAEKLLLQCVEIKKSMNNPVSLGITEIALGEVYFKNRKYSQAITSLANGLAKVREAGYMQYQKIALNGLALAYGQSGNYKEAYLNLNNFVQLNDSLLKESNNKIISELQTKYQTDKKEAEIQLLTKNQQLQKIELKQKQNEVEFAIAGGSLIFILLLIVIYSWRNKQKANLLLEEKNAEIHYQKELVEEKQKEVMDSIRYAKRIQQSLLPTEKYIERVLKSGHKKTGDIS